MPKCACINRWGQRNIIKATMNKPIKARRIACDLPNLYIFRKVSNVVVNLNCDDVRSCVIYTDTKPYLFAMRAKKRYASNA